MTDEAAPDGAPELEGGFQVRRNAARGFALGAALAVVVFAVFVLLPGVDGSAGLYVGLAVVLGVSAGLLATIVLVALRAARLARRL